MPAPWLIVGSGRCGVQLARSMLAAGLPLAGVLVHRAAGRARLRRLLPDIPAIAPGDTIPPAGAILIAVPDDAVGSCASALADRLTAPVRTTLHTSGLLPARVLAPLHKHGASLGSFHPLLTFPSAGGPLLPLAGVVATIEGEEGAVRAGLSLARALGMRPRRLAAAAKPAYHAAAVIAANLTHVLVAEARRLLAAAGFAPRQAAAALALLVNASVAAALSARGLERLTGPLARGDAATVAAHLAVLDPPLAAAYRAVARLALTRLPRPPRRGPASQVRYLKRNLER